MKKFFSIFLMFFLTLGYLHAQKMVFLGYGDSRDGESRHYTITGMMNNDDPDVVLHTGDLWDGFSGTFKSHLTTRPNLNDCLNANNYLIAKGNHEEDWEVLNFTPPAVRNNSLIYSALVNNCMFISLAQAPDANYLRSVLETPESQNADIRVIFHHYPIYSAGDHGASGNAAIEQLCDQYDVQFSVCGHDHHYERTHLIYNRQVVYTGDDAPYDVAGTYYMVAGGGGVDPRSVGSGWWTNTGLAVNHYCRFEVFDDRVDVTVIHINGNVIDRFTRRLKPKDVKVEITSPASAEINEIPASYSIAANVTALNSGESISKVEFFHNDVSLGVDNSAPYTSNVTIGDWGEHEIKVVGTTNTNKTGEASVTILAKRLNIALNKPVTIFDPYDNLVVPGHLNDGDMSTRASTLWQNNQSFVINLQEVRTIDRVAIYWEAAHASEYKIQVSTDNSNWTDAASVNNGDGELDEVEFTAVDARYVRLNCLTMAPGTVWGFSVWEMEVNDAIIDVEPTANFSASSTSVLKGEQVSFSDLSTGAPDSWSWSFTGGTPNSSTSQNPVITYNSTGTFAVSLTASNSIGSDTETKSGYITVSPLPAPVADFTASATTISIGQAITFTDQSENNPTAWSWTFESGSPATSTSQNQTVTYNSEGTFNVTLTATNATGSDSKSMQITVSPVPPSNVALNKPVTIFDPYDNLVVPGHLNDGNMTTRASTLWQNNQSFVIDLEAVYAIDEVEINWEGAFASEYKVQVSTDNSNWADVVHITNGDGVLDVLEFNVVNARYVRLNCISMAPGTVWGFSVWEMEVWGIPGSVPSGTWVELASDGFEGSWGNWKSNGLDALLNALPDFAITGSGSANIQDNSGLLSSIELTNGIDLSSYAQAKIDFSYLPISMDYVSEDFYLEYFDGSSWIEVARYVLNTDFVNGTEYSESVIIDGSYNLPANANFRFVCDASGNKDDIYLDDIVISASATLKSGVAPAKEVEMPEAINEALSMDVYPNPVSGGSLFIELQGASEGVDVAIFNVSGKIVYEGTYDGVSKIEILTSEFDATGLHFVKVSTDSEVALSKIIIQ